MDGKTWSWPERDLQLVFHHTEPGITVDLSRADLVGEPFGTTELRLIKALLLDSIHKVNARLVVLERGPEIARKLGVPCAGDE